MDTSAASLMPYSRKEMEVTQMKPKYSGALNKPMRPRKLGLLSNEDETQKVISDWIAEDRQNILTLCEHYKIPPGDGQFYQLALALAREIVPCFKEKLKEGKPKKWDDYTQCVLAVEIERLTEQGITQKDATKRLAKIEPWKSFLLGDSWDPATCKSADPADALKSQYKSATKLKLYSFTKNAFKYHEVTNTINEWNQEVLAIKKKNT
ncbi:hypothetical protein ACO0LG_01275 [Undibacterium sp. Ji42W]|uniref:hypothetical protein n=1 Tax=Undibacterium sp. Ji42W TaxID=3413039 RepID=UPI003BF44547